jgi:NADH-quinone oxidoreductase subunit J
MEINEMLFLAIALTTVLSALIVALSKKIIYSAFALLLTLIGFAGLFIYLSADFLSMAQIMIYVGGILILILFGVLMTQRIYDPSQITAHNSIWVSLAGGIAMAAITGAVVWLNPWGKTLAKDFEYSTSRIGSELLTKYLLPFEVISVLLLAVLIGAVYLGRSREVHK